MNLSLAFVSQVWVAALMAGVLVVDADARAADGRFEITVVDKDTQKPMACRMYLTNAKGKPRMVPKLPQWKDHFVFDGTLKLDLPRGDYGFELTRGPEYVVMSGRFTIDRQADDSRTIELRRAVNMASEGWYAGDLHVHRPLKDIELLMRAEDLYVCPVITWWNEKNEWEGKEPPAEHVVNFDDRRYYSSMAGEDEREGGALLYFNLREPLALSGSSREYPSPMKFLIEARKHQGVHVDIEKPFWWDVPVWLASGQVDSVGLAHNHMWRDGMLDNEAWGRARDKKLYRSPLGNGEWTTEIYYHILNAGLRIPPSAGSASGVLPNPVGYNRVYVHCGKEFTYENWWQGLKAGRVLVTNGPLLRPRVNGKYLPGEVFHGEADEELEFEIALDLATAEKIDYLEIVKDGRVAHSIRLQEYINKQGRLPPLVFSESGWFLLRAVSNNEKTYRFASTGPWYVEMGDQPRRISRESVRFFLDWLNERVDRVKLDDEQEREEVLKFHQAARAFWEAQLKRANAE